MRINPVQAVLASVAILSTAVLAEAIRPRELLASTQVAPDLDKIIPKDFGGWHLGTDTEMLSINDFKRGFGGKVVHEYQCEQILTLKGRLILWAAKLLQQPDSKISNECEPALNSQFPVHAPVAIK